MVAVLKDFRTTQVHRPMQGIIFGVLIGALLWSLLIAFIIVV